MASIPTPFVGWRGRRFYFKTDSISICFEGSKAGIKADLRKLLPIYRRVAVDEGLDELVGLIDTELTALEA